MSTTGTTNGIELRVGDEARRSSTRMNLPGALVMGIVSVVIGLGFLGLGAAMGTWPVGAIGIILIVLAVVVTGSSMWLLRRQNHGTIRFGDGTYEMRWTGRAKRFAITEVERVVPVRHMALGALAPTHHLIVLGRDRRLLLLVGYLWTTEQMQRIVDDLSSRGIPVYPFPEPTTPARLRAVDRRLIPFAQAHPVIIGFLTALGMLVALIVLFFVVMFIAFLATT